MTRSSTSSHWQSSVIRSIGECSLQLASPRFLAAASSYVLAGSTRMAFFIALLLSKLRLQLLDCAARQRVAELCAQLMRTKETVVFGPCVVVAIAAVREGCVDDFAVLLHSFDAATLPPASLCRLIVAAESRSLPGFSYPSALALLELAECPQLLKDQALLTLARLKPAELMWPAVANRLLTRAPSTPTDLSSLLYCLEACFSLQPLLFHLVGEEGMHTELIGVVGRASALLADGGASCELTLVAINTLSGIFLGAKDLRIAGEQLCKEFLPAAVEASEPLVDFALQSYDKLLFLEGFFRFWQQSALDVLQKVLQAFLETARRDMPLSLLGRVCRLLTFFRKGRVARGLGKDLPSRPRPPVTVVFLLLTPQGAQLSRLGMLLDKGYGEFTALMKKVMVDIASNLYVYRPAGRPQITINSAEALTQAVSRALLDDEGEEAEVELSLFVEDRPEDPYHCVSCGLVILHSGRIPREFNFICNRCRLLC